MTTPPPELPRLLMFVSGQPEPDGQEEVSQMVRNARRGIIVPTMLLFLPKTPANGASPSSGPDGAPPPVPLDHPRNRAFAPEQIACVEMVNAAAEAEHERVAVIDVNQPGDHTDLVAQWVGADDILPILVRPDGGRLVGAEQFTPRAVRRFLSSR
jgi:hypothetical protein